MGEVQPAGHRLALAGHDGAALAAGQGDARRRQTRRALAAPRLTQGGAYIGLCDLGAQGGALGQILDHAAGVGPIAHAPVDGDPAARRLDQNLEGVLDQGDVTTVRSVQGNELGLSRH